MITLDEQRLRFDFRSDCNVVKYEDWTFYKNHFQNGCGGGQKAVDFLCIQNHELYLIEVKDYRRHSRPRPSTVPSDLHKVVGKKVRDSLAGLVAARSNANVQVEQNFAVINKNQSDITYRTFW